MAKKNKNNNLFTNILIIIATLGVGYLVYDTATSNQTTEPKSSSELASSETSSLSSEIEIDEDTKAFYAKMVIAEEQEYFTYDNNQIKVTSSEEAISFQMGSIEETNYVAIEFDLTINEFNKEYSLIDLFFSKYDNNTYYDLFLTNYQAVVGYEKYWDDTTSSSKTDELTLNNENLQIEENITYNFKIISKEQYLKVLINDETIYAKQYDTGKYYIGYFGLTSSGTNYTIENAFYKHYSDTNEFDESPYYDILFNE